jgi:hypothetical protein
MYTALYIGLDRLSFLFLCFPFFKLSIQLCISFAFFASSIACFLVFCWATDYLNTPFPGLDLSFVPFLVLFDMWFDLFLFIYS